MVSKTVEELLEDHADPAWRARFIEYCDLIQILGDCLISDTYKVSDGLNAAIKLSPEGTKLRDRLATKGGVNAKDAKIMVALTVGHSELFVDIDEISLEALAASIDAELQGGRIHFAFNFGRELYDGYAEQFDEEKESLTNEETMRLIDQLPTGVFQYGKYTVGPFGVRPARTARHLPASRRVPAYHCRRAVCTIIHPTYLETSTLATINRDRDKLERILQESTESPAPWWEFCDEISGLAKAYYGDQRAGTHLPLLGDCLDLGELQALVAALLDTTKGAVRESVAPFCTVKDASVFVRDLDRAQLLQLTLFATERQIATGLDSLIADGMIKVPSGEIRQPIVNQRASGAFMLRGEIGSRGVRFASDDPGVALLRQRRLLSKLYLAESESEVHELEWQLRGIEITDLSERLEHFFQSTEPRKALERLVLVRHSNMITACEEVGIENAEYLTDDELIDTILWKLGFPGVLDNDPHSSFWRSHERLWALTQTPNTGEIERFIEAAGPYFTGLEGLLLDSLAFTSWALLTDHIGTDAAFSYDDENDRLAGLALLQGAYQSAGGIVETLDFTSQRVALADLVSGFGVLANRLEACMLESERCKRPASEFPSYEGKTDLKLFVLRSTVAFLDLSEPSRNRIIVGLREISSMLTGAGVSTVRNKLAHYRRNPPEPAEIEAALDATRRAVTRIETLGFCRMLFTRSTVTTDSWGQSRHEFTGPRSYGHAFVRPSRFDWMGMPAFHEPQYLLRGASFEDPREVLRFSPRFTSSFSAMWSDFPNRRRRGSAGGSDAIPDHGNKVEPVTR
jgi:hypothetical protein